MKYLLKLIYTVAIWGVAAYVLIGGGFLTWNGMVPIGILVPILALIFTYALWKKN